jgi:hypothetical protein
MQIGNVTHVDDGERRPRQQRRFALHKHLD